MLDLLSEISWSSWGVIVGALVILLVYLWDGKFVHYSFLSPSYVSGESPNFQLRFILNTTVNAFVGGNTCKHPVQKTA